MNVTDIIRIMANKLTNLRNAKIMAETNGQLEVVVAMEQDIMETENTIAQLKQVA
jgi:hypothetical protein